MLPENLNTIALLGRDSSNISSLLKVLLDKELEKTDFRDSDSSNLVYNLHLKTKNFTIQRVNLQEDVSKSIKVYYNSDILITYFTLDDNKKIDSQIKEHILLANVFGINNVIVILDSTSILDTQTFIKIRSKITDSFTKRNFKITNITFIECRGINPSLRENIYHVLQTNKGKLVKKVNEKSKDLIISLDNVFKIDKNHLGMTGIVNSGELNKDSIVNILPLKEKYRILEIQKEHKSVNKATKGEHVGIMIKNSNNFIQEGMVVSNIDTNIKPANYLVMQIINLNKQIINRGESYIFLSHNLESIGILDTISIKDTKKGIKELNLGEKALINVSFRESLVSMPHSINPKMGSMALLDKNTRELIGLGIVKNIKKSKY